MGGHQDHGAELISHSQNLLGPRATASPRPTPPYPQGPTWKLLRTLSAHARFGPAQGPWIPHCHQDCWAHVTAQPGPQG